MIQRIISLALILLFLVNCEREPSIKEFPVITTLNVTNIDATGATFRGELVKEGKTKTTSYGFTWGIQEPNINTSQKIVLGAELSEGIFETRINYSLATDFEYKIRTFATYSDKTVYGNIVTLLSKGSEQSIWSKEISTVNLAGWGAPYGWSDGKNGYVIFQNGIVYSYDPDTKSFSKIEKFPKSGDSGTKYTSIGLSNIQYVFSDIDNNLYKLDGGLWSVKSSVPFYYGYFGGYYHCYTTLNQIILLSSYKSYSYNPVTNQWLTKSTVPTARYSFGGTDVNGFAYVMTYEGNIQKYSPQDDNWQYITKYPGVINDNILAFSYNNKIYFGFSYADTRATNWMDENFWAFDLTANSWEKMETFPADLKIGDIFYFYLKGKLYIGHGNSGNYTIYSLNTSKLMDRPN